MPVYDEIMVFPVRRDPNVYTLRYFARGNNRIEKTESVEVTEKALRGLLRAAEEAMRTAGEPGS